VAVENPHPADRRRDPRRAADRRRYEDAVLAALDFEPELAPDVVAASRPRSDARSATPRGTQPAAQAHWTARPTVRLAALVVVHVMLAVVLAELLARGAGSTAVALAAAGWLTGTALIARTIFRAGARLRGRAA